MAELSIDTIEAQLALALWHLDAMMGDDTVEWRSKHREEAARLCNAIQHSLPSAQFSSSVRRDIDLRLAALRALLDVSAD